MSPAHSEAAQHVDGVDARGLGDGAAGGAAWETRQGRSRSWARAPRRMSGML